MTSIWKVFTVLLPCEKSYLYTFYSSYTWRQGESTCVRVQTVPRSHRGALWTSAVSLHTSLFPHFEGPCVFQWWHTSVSCQHTCSPQHTCKPRPPSPSPAVIGCSERLCDLPSCHYYRALMRTASAGASQEFSPFSDCHQVFRRLWAKVVTTFSMVWLTWLLSSSYILLESHAKHFFSSWRTQSAESVKGSLHSNYKDNI